MKQKYPEGLLLVKRFVSRLKQRQIISNIDERDWNNDLTRRVQHYGYRYDYRKRHLNSSTLVPPIPAWATQLIDHFRQKYNIEQSFDQLIINEYMPGQGIAPHTDSVGCFDNLIISVSLGSPCVMKFSRQRKWFEVLLNPGDSLVIQDAARYDWHHEIKPRKKDRWGGRVLFRKRRLSLTFRKILTNGY